MFIMVYLLMTFIMPSIMLNFNVFARAWMKNTPNEVLIRDAMWLIVVKVLNDRDNE